MPVLATSPAAMVEMAILPVMAVVAVVLLLSFEEQPFLLWLVAAVVPAVLAETLTRMVVLSLLLVLLPDRLPVEMVKVLVEMVVAVVPVAVGILKAVVEDILTAAMSRPLTMKEVGLDIGAGSIVTSLVSLALLVNPIPLLLSLLKPLAPIAVLVGGLVVAVVPMLVALALLRSPTTNKETQQHLRTGAPAPVRRLLHAFVKPDTSQRNVVTFYRLAIEVRFSKERLLIIGHQDGLAVSGTILFDGVVKVHHKDIGRTVIAVVDDPCHRQAFTQDLGIRNEKIIAIRRQFNQPTTEASTSSFTGDDFGDFHKEVVDPTENIDRVSTSVLRCFTYCDRRVIGTYIQRRAEEAIGCAIAFSDGLVKTKAAIATIVKCNTSGFQISGDSCFVTSKV